MGRLIFPGGRVHLLIPMKTYTSYDFSGVSVSVEPTPLDDTVFVAIPWL